MHVHRAAFVCVSCALLTACAGSPSGPSDTASGMFQGQTVNAIDGTAVAGMSVQVGRAPTVTTDSSGNFQADVGGPGTYAASIAGSAVVERHTVVSAPTAARARVSLIPASFDLQAFDQMFRTANARLQRWTTQPALVVVASVMSFRGGSANQYSATSDQMTDDEVALLIAHMTEGLSLLTGGTYTSFAAVAVERPASGDRVLAARSGKIVVGRYTGIVSFTETIGYGTWQEQPDGSVTGGSMFLDSQFDRTDSRRRLLRIHELGHALGYLHVTTRVSIMNPSIGPEPTDFDRTGAIIAFERPPGNVSPDVDPSSGPRGFSVGEGRWVAPVPCR
jgi:hypothetical protein